MNNYKIINYCEGCDSDEIVERVLKSRGIKNVGNFLYPQEIDMLPLDSMKYIDDARLIVEWGLVNKKKFGILFDVDTDGATSGAIMTRYLRNFTDKIVTHINPGKVHGLINIDWCKDCDVVIIVDSLNANIENYITLHDNGVKIIVLDHHAINNEINYDEYICLVSSQREYGNPALSGAGVVWKFCAYLDYCWGEYYSDDLSDLAACGILADVSDVGEGSPENRYIVYRGLTNLNNFGLKKIVGSYEFNSKAALFSVAPLINASCRCGDNNVAMNMFLTDDNKEALALKKKLEGYRLCQNEEVDRLLPEVYKQIEEQKDEPVLCIFINTQYGVAGLVGNKLLEKFNKPMFLINKDDETNVYGSMRSIGYGDFRTLCNMTGIAKLSGHEEASGFECPKDLLEDFLMVIRGRVSQMKQTTTSDVLVDCEISINDLRRPLIEKIKKINFISGEGFKPVTFKVTGIDNYYVTNFKQGKHLVLKPSEHIFLIYWNWNGDYEEMEDCAMFNEPVECYGELDCGFFGKSFALKVIMNDFKVG